MAISEFTTEELATEIWRDAVGYEGVYSVSNLGRIRRETSYKGHCKAGRILKPFQNKRDGYCRVSFGDRKSKKYLKLSRIVTEAFLGPRSVGMVVNHKDGNKANDRLCNLEYVTQSENVKHAFRTGLKIPVSGERHFTHTNPEKVKRGERHWNAKIKDADIPRIFELRESGLLLREIGALFGVGKTNISYILKGKARVKRGSL